MANISKSFLAVESSSMYNSSEWNVVYQTNAQGEFILDEKGEKIPETYSLKDIWKAQHPGMYEKIIGDAAPVTCATFENGIGKRITLDLEGNVHIDLKLSGRSSLEEGDLVRVDSIKGTLLRKLGQKDIIRYDGELAA